MGKEIAQAESYRQFTKELFTFLEWLTISAAIQWAGVKTGTPALAVIAFFLQLMAVVYAMLTGAICLRPAVQGIGSKALRWLAAIPLVLVLFLTSNWLVTTTVYRLVQTQSP